MAKPVFPFNLAELSAQLHKESFELACFYPRYTRAIFCRPSSYQGAFEQIEVIRANSRQIVCALCRINIVTGAARWREMSMQAPLFGPSSTNQRLKSRSEAMSWIEQVAKHGPLACKQLADQHATELLSKTSHARLAAADYLTALPQGLTTFAEIHQTLRKTATEEQCNLARKKLYLGVLSIPCETETDEDRVFNIYWIASLLAVLGESGANAKGHFAIDADPDENLSMGWCLQVMASELNVSSLG